MDVRDGESPSRSIYFVLVESLELTQFCAFVFCFPFFSVDLQELASTFEIKEDYAVLAKEKRTNKELACAPDGLCEVLELYREPTRDLALKVLQGIELEMNNYQGSTAVSAKIEFYLGLYHHAFLKDSAKRNRWLKLAVDSGKLDKTLKAAATILLKEA